VYKDFKDLLSILNANKVKYLIVGGYAVSHHAQPRATKDLALFVQSAPKNAEALYRALRDFGAPVVRLTPSDLIEKGSFVRFGNPPETVDILPEIEGVSFSTAWRGRVTAFVDEAADVAASFISSEDLISTKLAAGRPQDIADVAAIRSAGKAAGKLKHRVVPKKPKRKAE
jgi:hypothetical protein